MGPWPPAVASPSIRSSSESMQRAERKGDALTSRLLLWLALALFLSLSCAHVLFCFLSLSRRKGFPRISQPSCLYVCLTPASITSESSRINDYLKQWWLIPRSWKYGYLNRKLGWASENKQEQGRKGCWVSSQQCLLRGGSGSSDGAVHQGWAESRGIGECHLIWTDGQWPAPPVPLPPQPWCWIGTLGFRGPPSHPPSLSSSPPQPMGSFEPVSFLAGKPVLQVQMGTFKSCAEQLLIP